MSDDPRAALAAAAAEIAQLQSELAIARASYAEVDNLKSQVHDLSQQLVQLQTKNSDTETRATNAESQLDDLTQQKADLEKKASDAETAQGLAERDAKQSRSDLTSAQLNIESLNATISSLERDLAASRQSAVSVTAERNDLKAQLDVAEHDKAEAQRKSAADVYDTNTKMSLLQTELDKAKSDFDVVTSERNQLRLELAAEKDSKTLSDTAAASQLSSINESLTKIQDELGKERIRTATAIAQRDAFVKKFDDLYGNAEMGSGIAQVTVYRTSDGANHETLVAAQTWRDKLDDEMVIRAYKDKQKIPAAVTERVIKRLTDNTESEIKT